MVGLDPRRAEDLGRLLGMTAGEVVEKLCFRRSSSVTVEVEGIPIEVRPGTADVFTIDDTFGAGYHRSLWELPERPMIVDLGANVGLTAVDYSLRHPGATVVAVEMDAENAELARRNTARFPDVAIVHAGIAHVDGPVSYGQSETNAYAVARDGGRTAPGIRVDRLLNEHLPGRVVHLMKMDIEGAEQHVLAHADGWARQVQRILVETHPPFTREACLHELRRLGFDASNDERHPAAVSGTRVG